MAGFLFKSPSYQLVNANGDVYPGAKLNFYLTGTSTRSDSYQEAALSTPHTNPVIADDKGLFAPIYLDPDVSYKVVVTDADDEVLQTIDPVVIDLGTGNTPFKDLTPAANKLPYYTSSTAAALADFTSFGRSLVSRVSEAAFKTLVNLEIGTDVQAYDAYLDDVSGLTLAQGDLLFFDGTNITNLGPGTSGQRLETRGAGNNPVWVTPTPVYIKHWEYKETSPGGTSGATVTLTFTTHAAASTSNVLIFDVQCLFNCGGATSASEQVINFDLKSGGVSIEDQDVYQLVDQAASTGRFQYNYRFIVNPADTSTHVYTIDIDPLNTDSNTRLHQCSCVFEERQTA